MDADKCTCGLCAQVKALTDIEEMDDLHKFERFGLHPDLVLELAERVAHSAKQHEWSRDRAVVNGTILGLWVGLNHGD